MSSSVLCIYSMYSHHIVCNARMNGGGNAPTLWHICRAYNIKNIFFIENFKVSYCMPGTRTQ